jgi:hypothetical protein
MDSHILKPTGLTAQRLLPTRVDFYREKWGGEIRDGCVILVKFYIRHGIPVATPIVYHCMYSYRAMHTVIPPIPRPILLARRDINFDFNERQLPTFLRLFVSGSISRNGTDFKQ